MNTISTSKLSTIIGLQLPIAFLKSLGLEPAYEKHSGAMWNESDINSILIEIGTHFINKAVDSDAPYGYKKNGEPRKKCGPKTKAQ
jgi:hypothetical protein